MKSVAVVLGSGGARGLAFLGVLRVLSEFRISVGQVVGNSMGAILGAAFCAGVPIDELIRQACKWRRRDFVSLDLFGPSLFSHRAIRRLVEQVVPARAFEDLQIPLSVVCTDIHTGDRVVFAQGELIPPVVASSLAAGLFEPVSYQGRLLIDGGYVDPIPVSLCREDFVKIVVDPSVLPDRKVNIRRDRSLFNLWRIPSIFSQALKGIDILLYSFAAARNRDCNGIRVVPALGERAFFDFGTPHSAVDAGDKAMRAKLNEVWDAVGPEEQRVR